MPGVIPDLAAVAVHRKHPSDLTVLLEVKGVVTVESVWSAGGVAAKAPVEPRLSGLRCLRGTDAHRAVCGDHAKRSSTQHSAAARQSRAAHDRVLGVPQHVGSRLEADGAITLVDQKLKGADPGGL